jgi:hypothetical protein
LVEIAELRKGGIEFFDRGDVKVGDAPSIRYLLIELLSRSYIAEKIDARTNFFIFNLLYKRIFLLYIQ